MQPQRMSGLTKGKHLGRPCVSQTVHYDADPLGRRIHLRLWLDSSSAHLEVVTGDVWGDPRAPRKTPRVFAEVEVHEPSGGDLERLLDRLSDHHFGGPRLAYESPASSA